MCAALMPFTQALAQDKEVVSEAKCISEECVVLAHDRMSTKWVDGTGASQRAFLEAQMYFAPSGIV